MKKLLALLLAVVMLLGVMTLSGCGEDEQTPSTPSSGSSNNDPGDDEPGINDPGNQQTPEDLYALVSAATKKTSEATSFSALMKLDMFVDLMGNKTETKAEYKIQASMADPAKPIIGMNGTMTMMGQEMPYAYYFDGEWMYALMYGSGYKMRVSLDEFEKEAGSADELLVDLPKELFEGVTSTTEGELTKVELTADSEAFKKLYDQMIKELFADVLGESIDPVVVSDVKMVIAVADGYLQGYEMSFKANYTIGSDYITYEVDQSIVYESIGQDVTVEKPEGYEEFPELDWG